MALRLAASYATVGVVWVLFSDRVLASLGLPRNVEQTVASAKGGIYVVVTSLALYVLTLGMLRSLRDAREAVREQDRRIRQAYVDVIHASTGGKLVLVTSQEMTANLGAPLTQTRRVDAAEELSESRAFVRRILGGSLTADKVDSAVLAFGEALTNSLKHAGGAEYQVLLADEGVVQISVADGGPGIDFATLPKAALFPGFSTTKTLGMGFTVMLQTSERVLILTDGAGTRLVLEFR